MDARRLAELAERVAVAVRAIPMGTALPYAQAIDLICGHGVAPEHAAAVIAHGIEEGLFRATHDGLRVC